MDVATLRRAMAPTTVSDATLAAYLPHYLEAMKAAGITTVRRAAAFASQVGHESAGLRYMAEIQTSGPDWSWDRTRYRGRGPIQLTWQSNYSKFGAWCFGRGDTTDPQLFVKQPELVEQPKWGFLAASWYWLNAGPRPGQINNYADKGDILAVSRCINGWIEGRQPNGMADRQARWDRCLALGDALLSGNSSEIPIGSPGPWTGDPYWLADVLRAEGLNVHEVDGWQQRGQGDQGRFFGVVVHHTGSPNETPEGIAFHPTLGLAAHILIRPNGDVWVCGIGKANHAGKGSWQGIATDNANPVTFGVEVAILPVEGAPHRSGWPDVQYDAMVKVSAALLRRIAENSSHAISHKEWAQLGPAGWRQGKWDPGAIDMDIYRADVQTQIDRKSGADDMAQVPQDQWDRVYKELTKQYPSRSIYRTPGEGLVDTATGMSLNQDAMLHQELIERLAIQYGDSDAIGRIAKVAAGQGANPADQWAIAHATEVLRQIPADTLQKWSAK